MHFKHVDMSNVAFRHVAVFGKMSNDFVRPFDMSRQIEHVQFLSTCRTNEQQVAVEEASVDDFVDMSNVPPQPQILSAW